MPIYDYKCIRCNYKELDRIEKIDNELIPCPKCNGDMKRMLNTQFSINMGPCGAYGYYDDVLGKYISTNKERKAEMEQQGVTEKGGTPKIGSAWI